MVTEFPDEYRDSVAHTATAAVENSNPIEENGIKIPRVLIAFGSETGNAEAAALKLAKLLKVAKPIVMPLNEVAGLSIVRERRITHLLALTSTFGAGEAPMNAKAFASTDIADGVLSETKVAVLALGSTLYPDFCKAGVFLDQQLRRAGGKSLMPLKKVDDTIGSDGPIADWNALVSHLVLPANLKTILENRVVDKSTSGRLELKWLSRPIQPEHKIARTQWPADESFLCCENEELIEGGNVDARSTRKITFQLPEGATYVSGDHLVVQPLNSMDMVRRFGACFKDELSTICQGSGVDCADPVEYQMQHPFEVDFIEDGERSPARLAFSTPASLGNALQSNVDFAMKSNFVEDFLLMIERELSPDQDIKANKGISDLHGFVDLNARLCCRLVSLIEVIVTNSGNKGDHIDSFIQSFPTVVDLLETFGPILCASGVSKLKKGPLVPLVNLLPLLPRLRPRYYSISSSNKADPTMVSITVGVVHEETSKGVMIHGVCSNYLARLIPKKDRVRFSIISSNFRGPKTIKSPIILVGAGTGLAPMMGFIQDRVYDVAAAGDSEEAGEDAHLFFGCRSSKERIYAKKIDGWVSSGVVQLHTAFSREEGMPKKYVQEALGDYGPELCRLLLHDDTHYYICGDAKVGDSCYEVCIQVLRTYGNMSRVGAVAHINRMRVQHRWQFDLWGVISHFVEANRQIKKEKKR
jgi:sulfite reductase alpha subunit-like flavoprotein